jgi:hypothetical protein
MQGGQFAVGLLWLAVGSAFSQPLAPPPPQRDRPGRPVSFVACPQFRDTARQCWTAESDGKTYYIGGFAIGTPPQLLHRVLVEGVAHDSESSCGAITLDPVHLSPLPEIDAACDTILPDNGVIPKEPSIFDLPPAVLAANGGPMPAPPPLRSNTTFTVLFDFDRANLNLFNQANVEMMGRAIMNSRVQRVIVTGRSGRSRLADGSTMIESKAIGVLRAAKVSEALVLIGVAPELVSQRNVDNTPVDAQVGDVDSRNVTVEVQIAEHSTSHRPQGR